MHLQSMILDDTSAINNKLMELSMEKQKVIANNMANAETPGYIRYELDFQKKLSSIIESGDTKELEKFDGKLVQDDKSPGRLDGNNVTIPKEMNDMMQNSIFYSLLSKAFSTRMSILKNAIR